MNKLKETGFIITLLVMLTTSVAMQGKVRRIQETPLYRNSPVVVVGRELGNEPFNAEDRVWGDRNWLKHVAFDVKNISSKNIIYFELSLLIRKRERMSAAVAFPVEFGARMSPDGDTPESASRRKVLNPGEIVKVRISDSDFLLWTRELEKYGVSEVERVSLDIRTVEFDDGTAWYVGTELRRDPTGQQRWIPAVRATRTRAVTMPGWRASFVPISSITSLCGNTISLIPAFGRIFFARKTFPVQECGYFAGDQPYNTSCIGCTNPNDPICCDRRLDDPILSSPPAQEPQFGELIEQWDGCRGVWNCPTGTTGCGSCPTFLRKRFQPLTGVETCNEIDDDCDGSTDEDDVCCVPGWTPECEYPLVSDTCLKCCRSPFNGPCISPIVIDIAGDGFSLTDAANGVRFDMTADGNRERLGWTAAGSDDVWLALDRNGNGMIDDGSELFGSFTPQPEPPPGEHQNGFLALAVYDRAENGGNSDGLISRHDAIFDSLRLWRDSDHNGRSRNSEIFRLPQLGLRKIHLDYQVSNRVDEFGNRFRWRARVKDANDAQLGRWAWDVILVTQ